MVLFNTRRLKDITLLPGLSSNPWDSFIWRNIILLILGEAQMARQSLVSLVLLENVAKRT